MFYRQLLLLPLLALYGCSLSYFATVNEHGYETASCAKPGVETATIYVDSLGWHTGVILPSAEAATELGSLIPELTQYPWVEIGWGDRDFYMASGYSYWAGARALFFSRGSAVHAAGFSEPPEQFFADYQLVQLSIERERLSDLLAYIRAHLELDCCCESVRLGSSLYGHGSFYAGRGTFSAGHTCNSWTAGALSHAGCDIDTDLTRASSLLRELRGLGKR